MLKRKNPGDRVGAAKSLLFMRSSDRFKSADLAQVDYNGAMVHPALAWRVVHVGMN
jgi:hypothetical protein